MRKNFGEFFAELRRTKSGLGLREFCERYDYDPGNISRLERGKMQPPSSRKKLEEYAKSLGLEKDSELWFEFFDRASIERREWPEDLPNDSAIIADLPLLFRGLRDKKISYEDFQKLIKGEY